MSSFLLEFAQLIIHYLRDYNVYIYCKQCKRFVQIPEPAGYIAEVGAVGASIESLDLCDECIEANSAAEEEYCKTHAKQKALQPQEKSS